jgi:hypothetical protein
MSLYVLEMATAPAAAVDFSENRRTSHDQELSDGFLSPPLTLPPDVKLQCVPSCGDFDAFKSPDGSSRAVVVLSQHVLVAPWYKLVAADAFGAVGADAGRYWVADTTPSVLTPTIVPTPVLVNTETAGFQNEAEHPGCAVA